jgi:hypothetical protein
MPHLHFSCAIRTSDLLAYLWRGIGPGIKPGKMGSPVSYVLQHLGNGVVNEEAEAPVPVRAFLI